MFFRFPLFSDCVILSYLCSILWQLSQFMVSFVLAFETIRAQILSARSINAQKRGNDHASAKQMNTKEITLP